jgi:hypothetical protein
MLVQRADSAGNKKRLLRKLQSQLQDIMREYAKDGLEIYEITVHAEDVDDDKGGDDKDE